MSNMRSMDWLSSKIQFQIKLLENFYNDLVCELDKAKDFITLAEDDRVRYLPRLVKAISRQRADIAEFYDKNLKPLSDLIYAERYNLGQNALLEYLIDLDYFLNNKKDDIYNLFLAKRFVDKAQCLANADEYPYITDKPIEAGTAFIVELEPEDHPTAERRRYAVVVAKKVTTPQQINTIFHPENLKTEWGFDGTPKIINLPDGFEQYPVYGGTVRCA